MRDVKKMSPPSNELASAPVNAPESSVSAPVTGGHSFAQTSVLSAAPVQAKESGYVPFMPGSLEGAKKPKESSGYSRSLGGGAKASGKPDSGYSPFFAPESSSQSSASSSSSSSSSSATKKGDGYSKFLS